MTSNQIAYWRNEEDKRANREKERETRRHNLEEENVKKIANELEKLNLGIKSKQQMLDLAEMVAKYGYTSINQLSPEAKEKLAAEIGLDVRDLDAGSGAAAFWQEVKDTFKSIGGGKGLASFF